MVNGGEGGIRTHEELAPLAVFKTAALVHYATSPHGGGGGISLEKLRPSALRLRLEGINFSALSKQYGFHQSCANGELAESMAEGVGFEPTRQLLNHQRFSKPSP